MAILAKLKYLTLMVNIILRLRSRSDSVWSKSEDNPSVNNKVIANSSKCNNLPLT